MVHGSGHHSLYADSGQYPPKERSTLRRGAIYLSATKQQLSLSRGAATQLRRSQCEEPHLCLYRDSQPLWWMLTKSALHPWAAQVSAGSTTGTGVSQHARVRQCAAAKKEGRSVVRGTQEPDWTAPPALASDEVRARAVLSGGGCSEHQTTDPLPQPRAQIDVSCDPLAVKKKLAQPFAANTQAELDAVLPELKAAIGDHIRYVRAIVVGRIPEAFGMKDKSAA